MSKIKFINLFLSLVIAVSLPLHGFALEIGDEHTFVAGQAESTTTGTTNQETNTSTTVSNTTLSNNAVKSAFKKWKKDSSKDIKPNVTDRIVEVGEGQINKDLLEDIGNKWTQADEGDVPTLKDLTIWDLLPNLRDILLRFLGYDPGDLPNSAPSLPGSNLDVGDTYQDRGKRIHEYIEGLGAGDESVRMYYIREYTISSVAYSQVKTTTPIKWHGSDYYYLWNIEWKDANSDATDTLTKYGDRAYTHKFLAAGDYHVTATQCLESVYTDALTYNVVEYWVIADLDLVVYMTSTSGSQIKSSITKPMDDRNIKNVVYFDEDGVPQSSCYVWTAADEVVTVLGDNSVGGFVAASPWDEESDTVRTE